MYRTVGIWPAWTAALQGLQMGGSQADVGRSWRGCGRVLSRCVWVLSRCGMVLARMWAGHTQMCVGIGQRWAVARCRQLEAAAFDGQTDPMEA